MSSEFQQGVEQQLLGAGACEADSQLSPITAQLYATASLWANHNGPEETNGNEASLLLANQERGVEASKSSGGKLFQLQGLFRTIMIITVTHSQPKLPRCIKIIILREFFSHRNHPRKYDTASQTVEL